MTKIPQKVAKYYLSEVAQSGHTGSQNVLSQETGQKK